MIDDVREIIEKEFIHWQMFFLTSGNLLQMRIGKSVKMQQKKQKNSTQKILQNLESLNVKTCYFLKSEQAMLHSREIGIV